MLVRQAGLGAVGRPYLWIIGVALARVAHGEIYGGALFDSPRHGCAGIKVLPRRLSIMTLQRQSFRMSLQLQMIFVQYDRLIEAERDGMIPGAALEVRILHHDMPRPRINHNRSTAAVFWNKIHRTLKSERVLLELV